MLQVWPLSRAHSGSIRYFECFGLVAVPGPLTPLPRDQWQQVEATSCLHADSRTWSGHQV